MTWNKVAYSQTVTGAPVYPPYSTLCRCIALCTWNMTRLPGLSSPDKWLGNGEKAVGQLSLTLVDHRVVVHSTVFPYSKITTLQYILACAMRHRETSSTIVSTFVLIQIQMLVVVLDFFRPSWYERTRNINQTNFCNFYASDRVLIRSYS